MSSNALTTICERAAIYGFECLSDAELLSIILRGGKRPEEALKAGQNLIAAESNGSGLAFLENRSAEELMRHDGINRNDAIRLKLVVEAYRRIAAANRPLRLKIRTPQDAMQLVEAEMVGLPREELRAILMDIRNRVIRVVRVAEGGLSSSVISPRDLFREAVRANAAALILVHNHPSGDGSPSTEDIETTRRFIEMGEMIGVRVVDHIIIARNGNVSMKQDGLM